MSTGVVTMMPTPGITTEYFELTSEAVGGRFAISVSLPRNHAHSEHGFPLVYATDGNLTAPIADALRTGLVDRQGDRPVEPYIQVSIGYTAEDAPRQLVLRNRDLVPPGEPVPDFMPDHIRTRIQPESAVQAFFAQQRGARADAFLTFLEQELHPLIADRYRVRTDDVGLFGYSYGGLFTLFALTSGGGLLTRFGATSPGVVHPDSMIYRRYGHLHASDRTPRHRHLHMTVNEHEMLGPSRFYRNLAIEFLRVLDMLAEHPLPGLVVTKALVPGETHGSGLVEAYRSFLRTCYPAQAA